MQGEPSRDFLPALASPKQRHRPATAQKQFIGIAMLPDDGSGLSGWNRTAAKKKLPAP
jgi:hypothetical protein